MQYQQPLYDTSQQPVASSSALPLSAQQYNPQQPSAMQAMYASRGAQSFAPQELPDGLGQARDGASGPARTASHRREYSQGGAGQGNGQDGAAPNGGTGRQAGGPGGPYERPVGGTHNVKASSTTSLFTTRRNWSQHILEELQDFMHVLSPSGSVIFASASSLDLSGYTPEELFSRSIFDYIHLDDVNAFRRDFDTSLRTGDTLTLYYRFKTKDDRYVLFEVTGHPYYGDGDPEDQPGVPQKPKGRAAKCWFGMSRAYPSKNQAMLDSFLELKFENERLRQELLVMYKEVEGDAPAGGFPYSQHDRSNSFDASKSVIDPATGLVQTQTLIPSTSNTYGALGIGISANGTKGDGTGEKKKKKARVEEGEFVCRDCGTVDSPEWRKGPEGPKSLCNACGLRYAKLVSKSKKEANAAANKR
ncbi:hypothetical protein JCM8547_004425 [Rhodosporidiobolus lusitaniae]